MLIDMVLPSCQGEEKLTRTADKSDLSPNTISAKTFPVLESLKTSVPSL